MFLWKCQSFRDSKCLDLWRRGRIGNRTPNLRIHAECSNLLSYQGQTFAVPWFEHWLWWYRWMSTIHLCPQVVIMILHNWNYGSRYYTPPPPNNEVVGGYFGFTPSVRLSVRPSVRLSRLPCPLCNSYMYSSGWILSILATNDHCHERVCHTQWPLTLTYISKVIRPWLRKSCPLCSVYSSGWILFIFGTNDHYH